MTDLLATGAAWLGGVLKLHASRTIAYRRGDAAVDLTATRGQTKHEASDEYGVTIEVTSQDFIVPAGDLTFGGRVVLPQPGDVIEELTGGNTFTYEVMPFGPEKRCFRLNAETVLRIHTKEIDTD